MSDLRSSQPRDAGNAPISVLKPVPQKTQAVIDGTESTPLEDYAVIRLVTATAGVRISIGPTGTGAAVTDMQLIAGVAEYFSTFPGDVVTPLGGDVEVTEMR